MQEQTRASMDEEIARTQKPNSLGHITRFSDSSIYDERCVLCGGTDAAGDRSLQQRCPKAIPRIIKEFK